MSLDTGKEYIEGLKKSLRTDIDGSISLISVSLGPVQEYIAEARKMRDLWIGSYLLALCSYRVMLVIMDRYGTPDAIVHPSVANTALYQLSIGDGGSLAPSKLQISAIPNHFVAVARTDDLTEILASMKKAVDDFWTEMVGDVAHSRIKKLVGSHFPGWDSRWKDHHVLDAFYLMWVSIPTTVSDLVDNYGRVYRTLQHAMEARKLTRTFRQNLGSSAVKCQQCGRREVIGPTDRDKNAAFFEKLRKTLPAACLKEGERICAVCIIKRIVKEGDVTPVLPKVRFDSTSDIASVVFRTKLNDMARQGDLDVQTYLDALKGLGNALGLGGLSGFDDVPGDWFYDESFIVHSLKKYYTVTDEPALHCKAETAASALKKIKTNGIGLSKYYGILLMDGDHLGKAMSSVEKLDDQRVLSGKISYLANDILPQCVDRWQGQTIYSGGDDILAVGPLTGCLSALEELRTRYQTEMGSGKQCSASLVVVHHKSSLQNALHTVRDGLNKAKEAYGRNAIVISVVVSSGSTLITGCKWDIPHGGGSLSFVEIIKDFFGAMGSQGLTSPRFVYDLLRSLPVFYYRGNDGAVRSLSRKVFAQEINRIATRHTRNIHVGEVRSRMKSIGPQEIEILLDLSDPIFWQRRLNIGHVDVMDNMLTLLRISAFLAREDTEVL